MWFLFLRRISRWNCSTEFVCFKISKHILPAVGEFVNLGQWFPQICIGTMEVSLLKQGRRRRVSKSKFK